jgi:ribonuclease HIII
MAYFKRMTSFVTEINIDLAGKLKEDLESQGFLLTKPPYTLLQGKKTGISITLYTSGKLIVQGKDKEDFLKFYLEPEILGSLAFSHPEISMDMESRIGVDEAGKGDFFGPLCIAAFYADENILKELVRLGIKDSKQLGDPTILKMAKELRRFPHTNVSIFPTKYNDLYSRFKNLNHLLAWGHATAIEELMQKTNCNRVIIDQFAHESVVISALHKKGITPNLTQRVRGEEDPVVAAASILARAAFVEGIERLEKAFNTPLPKGASRQVIEAGRRFIEKHSREELKEVAKLHFKTTLEL